MDLSNLTKEELKVVAKYYNLTFNKRITRAGLESLIFLAQIQHCMSLSECLPELMEVSDHEMD